jgi:hypothetical protein
MPSLNFGDLAVLYNETRAATISARSESENDEKVTLYRIKEDTFKNILYNQQRNQQRHQLNQTTSGACLGTMQQIDDAINEISGRTTLYGGNIILPYQPERVWLWKNWSKTILGVSYKATVLNMLLCRLFLKFAGHHPCHGESLSWRQGRLTPDLTFIADSRDLEVPTRLDDVYSDVFPKRSL